MMMSFIFIDLVLDMEAEQSAAGAPGSLQHHPHSHVPPPLIRHHHLRVTRGRGQHVSTARLHLPCPQPSDHLEPGWNSS